MTTSEKRRANKDEIEIQKLFLELPKAGIGVITFFATAGGLILKFGSGNQTADILSKLAYGFGLLVSLFALLVAYNFMTIIVSNAIEVCDTDAREKKFEVLKETDYPWLKTWLSASVFIWVLVLGFLTTR